MLNDIYLYLLYCLLEFNGNNNNNNFIPNNPNIKAVSDSCDRIVTVEGYNKPGCLNSFLISAVKFSN